MSHEEVIGIISCKSLDSLNVDEKQAVLDTKANEEANMLATSHGAITILLLLSKAIGGSEGCDPRTDLSFLYTMETSVV